MIKRKFELKSGRRMTDRQTDKTRQTEPEGRKKEGKNFQSKKERT